MTTTTGYPELDEIARRAGVGNATMYRHFPTRRDMVIAVYAEEVTALGELGRTLLADPSPADALFAWLRAFIAHVSTKGQLPLAIPDDDAGQRSALYREWHATMHTAAAGLLRRAQEADAIKADLSVADLLASAERSASAPGGGRGIFAPSKLCISHWPRSTGEVRFGADVAVSTLPWPSTPGRGLSFGHSTRRIWLPRMPGTP